MSNKEDVRSYVNPYPPRFSEAAQIAVLTGTIYKEDKSGAIFESLKRSIREGSLVEVADAFLLAPVRGRPSKRREALVARFDAVEDKGGIVWCRATGYRSNNRKQLRQMIMRANDMIARSGQGAPGKSKSGRPSHRDKYTDAQWKAMGHIWDSRKYDTGDKALAAIHALGIKVKRGYMYRYFGKRD